MVSIQTSFLPYPDPSPPDRLESSHARAGSATIIIVTTTSVTLPVGVTPWFPDRCIVCGKAHPGTREMRASAPPSGRSPRWYLVKVPVCPSCGARLQFGWAVFGTAQVLAVIGGIALYAVLRLWVGWLVSVLGAAAGGFAALWGLDALSRRSLALSVDARGDTVEFRFRDATLAREVAAHHGVVANLSESGRGGPDRGSRAG